MPTASFFVGHSHHRVILSRSILPGVNFSRRFTLRKRMSDDALARVCGWISCGHGFRKKVLWLGHMWSWSMDNEFWGECQRCEMSKVMKRKKYIYLYVILYVLEFLTFRIVDTHPIFLIFYYTIRLLVISKYFVLFDEFRNRFCVINTQSIFGHK